MRGDAYLFMETIPAGTGFCLEFGDNKKPPRKSAQERGLIDHHFVRDRNPRRSFAACCRVVVSKPRK